MKSSVFTVFKSPKIYASRASNIKLVLKFLAFYDAKKELLKNTRLVCRANQNKSKAIVKWSVLHGGGWGKMRTIPPTRYALRFAPSSTM